MITYSYIRLRIGVQDPASTRRGYDTKREEFAAPTYEISAGDGLLTIRHVGTGKAKDCSLSLLVDGERVTLEVKKGKTK